MKKDYLFSYQFDTPIGAGFGNITITVTFNNILEYFKGYKKSYLHDSRKVIANNLRKSFNLPKNKKVKVIILNIVKI